MNVSLTPELEKLVSTKVASGRYNSASEVVREALRRMEEDDQRALRLAKPTVEDILSDLTGRQIAGIHERVRAGIESIDGGEYTEYDGRDSLQRLPENVKARGRRRLLARETSRE